MLLHPLRFLMYRAFAIIFVLLAVFVGTAPAVTLQQLSLDQMSQAATAIVRARVTGSSANFIGPTIYTHYQLQVSETWKGFTPTEVAVQGGVATRSGGAAYRQSFPGVPQLTVGTEYVLFLWTSSTTGITHLVGLSQGLFNLAGQSDGSTLAVRPMIGELMLDASGHRVTDHAIQIEVTGLKTQVGHALVHGGRVQ
jgi:hypothetical protein